MNCDTNFSRKPGALPVCSLMGAAKREIFCCKGKLDASCENELEMNEEEPSSLLLLSYTRRQPTKERLQQ
jgi:hypothetical protein